MHIGTFVAIVPEGWIAVPFVLMIATILCSEVVKSLRIPWLPGPGWGLWSGLLLAYFLITFSYVLYVTGGATSANIRDGHYVYMYKGRIIRTITAQEYMMYPNLVGRVMSALTGSMSAVLIGGFRD
jgi:hypothetical protein